MQAGAGAGAGAGARGVRGEEGAALLGSSWNRRTAGWLSKSKSAHVADAVPLVINMTLNFVCALGVAGLVPVASVCPSQDRHEPWLLERPNGSTPKNQMRADAGADMTKLDLGRGHSRDPNFP